MRTYAIGDIHGQLDMLLHAHAMISDDRALTGDDRAPVVHLGDLVDRGPDSCGVVDFLMKGTKNGEPWITLKGNHDRYLSRFLDDPHYHEAASASGLDWLNPRLGGDKTLASYGVEAFEGGPREEFHAKTLARMPPPHRSFLNGLPLFYLRGEIVFVHAGIRPGIPMEDQTEDDLIWIRQGFINDHTDHGFLVVHGHTALEHAQHHGNRVNLDSGAGYFRPITAAVFEDRNVWILTDHGRVPLLPE